MPRDFYHFLRNVRSATRLEDVPHNSKVARFYRERNSHRGIANFQTLKKLDAGQVNQDFLEEICSIEGLEQLSLEWVRAENLNPLRQLKKLRMLRVEGAGKVIDFKPLSEMTQLSGLYIEHAKHLNSLDFLSDAHHLSKLGIEGSMYTKQKIPSLAPLTGLRGMMSLFMTSVQLADKELGYLATCPKLVELQCARFAPKSSFDELRRLMPKLQCDWCDRYEIPFGP